MELIKYRGHCISGSKIWQGRFLVNEVENSFSSVSSARAAIDYRAAVMRAVVDWIIEEQGKEL